MIQRIDKSYPFIILLGIVFYLPFLGAIHLFDWDEINFAESAREMIVTGNYTTVQINFQPFWEKPPLFFWFQVLSMKTFGINEFAARFPNAIVGIVTLLVFYSLGKKLHGASFGWLWVLGYLGSLTPFLYFKTGIIDPTFNLFIFLSIWFTANYFTEKQIFKVILAGFFMGLAVLTKGPVALLIWALVVGIYWLTAQTGGNRNYVSFIIHCSLFIIVALLTSSIWFGLEFYKHGTWFFEQFIQYQIRLFSTPDAGHEQPFYYHFLVVLLGCFPVSVLAIKYLFRKNFQDKSPFFVLMFILFWVVMILFSIVRTKIVHYSSLAWFPVSYFGAYYLSENANKWHPITLWGFRVVGVLLALVLVLIPLIGMNTELISPYIKDVFAVANLKAAVNWQGWEWLIGVVYLGIIWTMWKSPRRLFIGTAVCIWLYSAIVIPNIEGYTQRAAISFYQSLKGQNVDVETVGFKSYAQLFYFEKMPQKAVNADSLLNAKSLSRPAYFVTKNDRAEEYLKNKKLKLIKKENGFLFFYRK